MIQVKETQAPGLNEQRQSLHIAPEFSMDGNLVDVGYGSGCNDSKSETVA